MTSNSHSTPSTTLIMPSKGTSAICAEDLLQLLPDNCQHGVMRWRRVVRIIKKVRWSYCFVVLAQSAIYIYENEKSKSPIKSIPLLGYVGVERETVSTCSWVFALVPRVPSLKRESFACTCDSDRKEWMSRIKDHLVTANNGRRNSSLADSVKLLEDVPLEVKDYVEIELPIVSPSDLASQISGGSRNLDIDSDSDDDEDGGEDSKEISRRPSINAKEKRKSDDVRTNSKELNEEILEASSDPPRYSALVDGEEIEYQNLPNNSKQNSRGDLEKACLITDEKLSTDRERCIAMLKETGRVGTYLIRQSRTGDYQVLSVLTAVGVVKELRIESTYGLVHLMVEPSIEFSSLSSLLAYFSSYKPVPNQDVFLAWGIHESQDGGNKLYETVDGF